MVVPSASGCRRTPWPVGPGLCGLRGAPSSMVMEPVTSCRGSDFSLNPGKPELAWWTTSSMVFGRRCGKRSNRVAHYRAPGRRLGKRHVPRNTHKTDLRGAHKRGHTHLSLAHRSRCPWGLWAPTVGPWGGCGVLGDSAAPEYRPSGNDRQRPYGSFSDVQAGGRGTRCLDGRPLTRQYRELSGLVVGLESATGGATGPGVQLTIPWLLGGVCVTSLPPGDWLDDPAESWTRWAAERIYDEQRLTHDFFFTSDSS
jgi:hypothetical protein